MNMRTARLMMALAFATIIIILAMPARSQAVSGEYGNSGAFNVYWHMDPANGGTGHCGMETYWRQTGRYMTVVIYHDGAMALFFEDPTWRATSGGSVVMRMAGRSYRLPVTPTNDGGGLYTWLDDVQFLRDLADAWTAEVDFPYTQDWAVTLRGSSYGINLLFECHTDMVIAMYGSDPMRP